MSARWFVLPIVGTVIATWLSAADQPPAGCAALPSAADLRRWLADAAGGKGIAESLGSGGDVGGLFKGEREWAAVVDRHGTFSAVTTSQADATQVWPASQAIAK